MDRIPHATLLIVEDDLGLARLQQRRLERAGYAVLLTANAEEAAQRAQQGDIDLLILDQLLPGGVSGLELYRRIRAANLDVPAILVTGLRQDELLLQALRAGVRDFVFKTPEYLDYLLPAVERVLKQVSTERQLVESRAHAREALYRQHELEIEIVQRKRAEEMLKEADRRKNEFLAMLSHELRNPLAPIRNSIQVLQLRMPNQEALTGPLEVIDRQVKQLAGLVDDLLDVARITHGQINLRKQTLELAEVVAQAVETSRPLLEARRHRFDCCLPDEPIFVEADPTRLAQVILNLLNNAAKYTEEGGYINLSVERQDDEVVLRVRDSGIGISPNMLSKIFELFTQGERTLDRSQGGLGIGLTLVRRLVELHGGTVRAFSEGLGRGSEFVVRLPILQSSGEWRPAGSDGKATVANACGSSPLAPPRRILIIDDNQDSADSLAILLHMLGHEVRVAYDGESGLLLAEEFSPDIMLIDIGLPRLSGLEAAQRIRHDLGLRDALLIAMTGYGQEEDKRRSREAGFNAHLVKPVDFSELQALMKRFEPAAARN
ncbi:MAG TPA: response regulator [Gemmataceae bacterium]|nr:response regulator [Gemmataceae bacterium]